jgi:hypothetical protein
MVPAFFKDRNGYGIHYCDGLTSARDADEGFKPNESPKLGLFIF